MAQSTQTLVALITSLLAISALLVANSRPLISTNASSARSLASRLKVEEEGGGSSNCWESLFELQACSGEIITFFLNGEAYLGRGCCKAIRVIGHECWPNVVGSLGFTSEESDILQGYCDEEEAVHSPTTPPTPTTTPLSPVEPN